MKETKHICKEKRVINLVFSLPAEGLRSPSRRRLPPPVASCPHGLRDPRTVPRPGHTSWRWVRFLHHKPGRPTGSKAPAAHTSGRAASGLTAPSISRNSFAHLVAGLAQPTLPVTRCLLALWSG